MNWSVKVCVLKGWKKTLGLNQASPDFFFFRHDTQFSLLTTLSLCTDFTRLKLVQGKKEQEQVEQAKEMAKKKLAAKIGKENEEDITAAFDAADDQDVVF